MKKFLRFFFVCFLFLLAFQQEKISSHKVGNMTHRSSSNCDINLHEADIEITNPVHLTIIESNKVVLKWTAWADSGLKSFSLIVWYRGDGYLNEKMFEEEEIKPETRAVTLRGLPNGGYEAHITLKTNSDGDRWDGVVFRIRGNEDVSNPQIKGLPLGTAIPIVVFLCYSLIRKKRRNKVND